MEDDAMTNTEGPVRATGRCLCGSVKYSVHGPLRSSVVACHCRNCRRFTGGLWAGTTVRKEHVAIEGGSLKWYQSSAEAKRGFCDNCGSSLFWQESEEPIMAIAAGSLDEPTGLKLAVHCWTSQAADYWSFDPDIPRRGEYSGLAGPEE
jgi:hypothetical protein